MTNSLMEWHLSRDNQRKLALFCDKHQINRQISQPYRYDGIEGKFFTMTTHFDNDSFIKAELEVGTSIADYYQVIDYGWGKI